MKLNDKVYTFLKWFLMIFSPALLTLVETLGIIYKFDTNLIIGTYSAFATFLGAIVGISTMAYNKDKSLQELEENLGKQVDVEKIEKEDK